MATAKKTPSLNAGMNAGMNAEKPERTTAVAAVLAKETAPGKPPVSVAAPVPAKKVQVKPAAKTPVASTKTPPTANKASASGAAAKSVKAVKAAKDPKADKTDKTDKADKSKKPKLVRDSFTIPKAEYLVLDELKQRAVQVGRPSKKSELLRAGIKALAAMSDAALLHALSQVPAIKTGRPSLKK